MTIHKQTFLYGTSKSSETVSSLINGPFDIAIFTSSWDARSVVLAQDPDLNFVSNSAFFIDLPKRDKKGLRDTHDKQLEKFCESNFQSSWEKIYLNKSSMDQNWELIWLAVLKCYDRFKRPLRLFIDLSTCPRYYSVGIISSCIKQGIAKSINAFYAEGEYPEPKNSGTYQYDFKIGKWETIPIAALSGQEDPGKDKYYLVSVGFEGAKIMRTVSSEDPDRISILFPAPSVKEGYHEITMNNIEEIIQQYKIPDKQIIKAHAADAIEVWKKLQEASVERPETESTYYLCSGTKAHTLGMALRALCLQYPNVLYNRPAGFNCVEVKPNGKYWCYEIFDLSLTP